MPVQMTEKQKAIKEFLNKNHKTYDFRSKDSDDAKFFSENTAAVLDYFASNGKLFKFIEKYSRSHVFTEIVDAFLFSDEIHKPENHRIVNRFYKLDAGFLFFNNNIAGIYMINNRNISVYSVVERLLKHPDFNDVGLKRIRAIPSYRLESSLVDISRFVDEKVLQPEKIKTMGKDEAINTFFSWYKLLIFGVYNAKCNDFDEKPLLMNYYVLRNDDSKAVGYLISAMLGILDDTNSMEKMIDSRTFTLEILKKEIVDYPLLNNEQLQFTIKMLKAVESIYDSIVNLTDEEASTLKALYDSISAYMDEETELRPSLPKIYSKIYP